MHKITDSRTYFEGLRESAEQRGQESAAQSGRGRLQLLEPLPIPSLNPSLLVYIRDTHWEDFCERQMR